MYYCCRKLKIDWEQAKYLLLGDDVLIGDDRLAKAYIETIRSLQVEVSDVKTHISHNLCEFAKR
jgi:hypothetical protein